MWCECLSDPTAVFPCLIRNSLFNPNNFYQSDHPMCHSSRDTELYLRVESRGNVAFSIWIGARWKSFNSFAIRYFCFLSDKRLLFVRTIAVFLVFVFVLKIWRISTQCWHKDIITVYLIRIFCPKISFRRTNSYLTDRGWVGNWKFHLVGELKWTDWVINNNISINWWTLEGALDHWGSDLNEEDASAIQRALKLAARPMRGEDREWRLNMSVVSFTSQWSNWIISHVAR